MLKAMFGIIMALSGAFLFAQQTGGGGGGVPGGSTSLNGCVTTNVGGGTLSCPGGLNASSLLLTAGSSTTVPIATYTTINQNSYDSVLTSYNSNRATVGYYGVIYTSTPGFLTNVTTGKAIADTIACPTPLAQPLGTCTGLDILDATGFGVGTVAGAANTQPFTVDLVGDMTAAGNATIAGNLQTAGLNASGAISATSGTFSGGLAVTGNITATGTITALPDGVHPGALDLVGNTTNWGVPANSVILMGPASASFTGWGIQWGTGAPSSATPILSCGTQVGSTAVWTCSWVANAAGSVTWPASGDVVLSTGTNTPGGVAPVNGDCIYGSGGVWTAGNCGTYSGTVKTSTSANTSVATAPAGTVAILDGSGNLSGTTQIAGVVPPMFAYYGGLAPTASSAAYGPVAGFTSSLGGTSTGRQMAVPRSGSIGNLTVCINTAQPSSGSLTIALATGTFNGTLTATSQSVTIAASAAIGCYTTAGASATYTSGQGMAYLVTNAATATGAAISSTYEEFTNAH